MMRELMDVEIDPPEGLKIKLAETQNEILESYRILHDAYVEAGYIKSSSTGKRIIKHFCLPTTSTIVAKIDDEVVGTLSIIQRTNLGLPFENIYQIPDDYKKIRIAEVSSLAIDSKFRLKGGAIFLPMCKFFYEYVTNYLLIDRVYISVIPGASKYYESILLFDRVTSKPIKYATVDASVVILTADLAELKKKFVEVYSNKKDKKNLYKYFVDTKLKSLMFPERKYYKFFDNCLSPENFTNFFTKESSVLNNLTVEERKSISSFLPPASFQKIIWGDLDINSVREHRFISKLSVDWAETIMDISSNGLKALNPRKISNGMWLEISVSKEQNAQIQVDVAWVDKEKNQVGLKIIDCNEVWQSYIEYLNLDFEIENKIPYKKIRAA